MTEGFILIGVGLLLELARPIGLQLAHLRCRRSRAEGSTAEPDLAH